VARIGAVRPLSKIFAVAPMLFSLALAQAQEPTSPGETAAQLAALADEIQAIQQKLDAQENERSTLQQALREADLQISESDRRLAEVMQAQKATQQKLTQLDSDRTRLLVAQRDRTDIIEQGIQQLWAVQQGGGLRVWLGDQDPQQVARHLAYLERIVADQQVIIAEYQRSLVAIEENRQATEDTQSQLDIQRETLADTQRALADQQAAQQQAIADIDATLQTDQQRLAELERDQQRLNALLGELQNVAVRSENLPPANLQPFADTRGTLAMPVNGTPANRFGEYSVLDNNERQTYGAKWLTDVKMTWHYSQAMSFNAGVNNLFDVTPDRNVIGQAEQGHIVDSEGQTLVNSEGVFEYSRRAAPFGFNGAYYYAGVNYRF